MADIILTHLEKTMAKKALQWQTGRQIFCRSCDKVLDVASAVGVDTKTNGKLASSFVLCSTCFDKRYTASAMNKAKRDLEQKTGEKISFDIADGRELFGNGKRAGGVPVSRSKARRTLSEVYVMGIFAGYRETSGKNAGRYNVDESAPVNDHRLTSPAKTKEHAGDLFNTRGVKVRQVWKAPKK